MYTYTYMVVEFLKRTFYISQQAETVFNKLDDILHNDKVDFSNWAYLQADNYVKSREANKEPEPPKAKCEFPRIKKQGLNCEWVVCPFIDRSYGELAQKRQFAGKEKCLYRFRGEVS